MKSLKLVVLALVASLLSGVAHASADAPLVVAQKMVNAWNTRNWEQVYDLFAEDGKLQSMMFDPIEGRETISKHLGELVSGIEEIELKIRTIGVINENTVVLERVDDFVFNGKRTLVPVVGLLEIDNGKVAYWREYYDRATLVAGLVGPGGAAAATHDSRGDGSEELLAFLKKLREDWNGGDMQAYLDAYWDDESMVLVSNGRVIVGKQAMTDLFTSTWPSVEKMGTFTTENEHVALLSHDEAIISGEFTHVFPHLTVDAAFTHVMKRIDGQWKIVNEHTSRKNPKQ
jgi:limonene-1,2-epoxide hydrolase